MSSSQFTPDALQDACLASALRSILTDGKHPEPADTAPLTGERQAVIVALVNALDNGGTSFARQQFNALARDGHPWLFKLASTQPHNRAEIESHAVLALQALLDGRMPEESHVKKLSGDLGSCITSLVKALQHDGHEGVKKAFKALAFDRPWLNALASAQPPVFAPDGQLLDPAAVAEAEKPQRQIRFISTSEMLRMPDQEWLIPAILPRESIALVYGESGALKSFLVLAWSLCIATGSPWLGRNVVLGPVAYIAAEGGFGMKKRTRAWMTFHHWEDSDTIGVNWYLKPMMMQDPRCLTDLIAALKEDFSQPPVLVVIDTLSRCAAGADEDSNTEMAEILARADLIREELHCTVLIVHHVGKDSQRGPRGASALICNVEAAIAVTPTDAGNKLECAKAKDSRPFDRIYLQKQEVIYGPYPEINNSLVLIAGGESEETNKNAMTKDETMMYNLLIGRELAYGDWVKAATDPSRGSAQMKEASAKFAIGSLKKAGRVLQKEKRGPYSIVQVPSADSDMEESDLE